MEENPFQIQPKPPEMTDQVNKVAHYSKKPWVIILFSSLVVLGVIGYSVDRVMGVLLHSKPEVIVPSLEGKLILEALHMVSGLVLALHQEGTEFDEALTAGTIVRQHPPAGIHVRAGRAIRVVISKGGQVLFIPDLIGKPLAEAQSVLASNGLQMGAVQEFFSATMPEGGVIDQNPHSGEVGTRGALVDVQVSKGSPPAGPVLIPDF